MVHLVVNKITLIKPRTLAALCTVAFQGCFQGLVVERCASSHEPRRREYRRSAVDDADVVVVVVVLFLEKPRWSRPSPHRGGVGYDHGPSPAPFMGASRRVVTLPNFTTWSRDTARIPLGITPFPRVSARGCRLSIVVRALPCANTGVSKH